MTGDPGRDAAKRAETVAWQRDHAAAIALKLERAVNRIVDDEAATPRERIERLWALYASQTTTGKFAMKALAFEMLAKVR